MPRVPTPVAVLTTLGSLGFCWFSIQRRAAEIRQQRRQETAEHAKATLKFPGQPGYKTASERIIETLRKAG